MNGAGIDIPEDAVEVGQQPIMSSGDLANYRPGISMKGGGSATI